MWRNSRIIVASALVIIALFGVAFLSWFRRSGETAQAKSESSDLTFKVGPNARTIVDAFQEAGVEYYPEDKVTAFPSPSLGIGSVVEVDRAPVISLMDGKREYIYRSFAPTLDEFLQEKKIELGADDKIDTQLSEPVTDGMKVKITRVEKTTVKEKEVVTYKSVDQKDATMYRGETKLTQDGKNGLKEKTYLVIRKDGDMVSKTLTSTNWIDKVQDKITKIGTKLKIDNSKTRTGVASYYSGRTRIASNYLPKGTKVLITNPANGKSFEGVVDDYMAHPTRVVDLNPSLWQSIAGAKDSGLISGVRVEVVLN